MCYILKFQYFIWACFQLLTIHIVIWKVNEEWKWNCDILFVSFWMTFMLAEWANSNVIIKWLEIFNLDYTFSWENPKDLFSKLCVCYRIMENPNHFVKFKRARRKSFFEKTSECQLWILCHECQSIENQLFRNSFSVYNSYSKNNAKERTPMCVYFVPWIQFNQNQFLIVQRIGSGFL